MRCGIKWKTKCDKDGQRARERERKSEGQGADFGPKKQWKIENGSTYLLLYTHARTHPIFIQIVGLLFIYEMLFRTVRILEWMTAYT